MGVRIERLGSKSGVVPGPRKVGLPGTRRPAPSGNAARKLERRRAIMPYNLNIPGWMPESELKILEEVAQTIPKGGRMVEVGPFCGRSSWCLAKSADPSVKVTCLDIWDTSIHPYHPPTEIGER